MALYNDLEKRLNNQDVDIDNQCKKHVSETLLNADVINTYAGIAAKRVETRVGNDEDKIKKLEDRVNELELALLGKSKNIRYQIQRKRQSPREL